MFPAQSHLIGSVPCPHAARHGRCARRPLCWFDHSTTKAIVPATAKRKRSPEPIEIAVVNVPSSVDPGANTAHVQPLKRRSQKDIATTKSAQLAPSQRAQPAETLTPSSLERPSIKQRPLHPPAMGPTHAQTETTSHQADKQPQTLTPAQKPQSTILRTPSSSAQGSVPRPGSKSTHGPPHIAPSMLTKIPLLKRQKALAKFYDEFLRIYGPILDQLPSIAHDHALEQEWALHEKSVAATYTNFAVGIVQRLRSRPISTGISDVGIDGKWTKDLAKTASVTSDLPLAQALKDISRLLLSEELLVKMGYPVPPFDEVDSLAIPIDKRDEPEGQASATEETAQDGTQGSRSLAETSSDHDLPRDAQSAVDGKQSLAAKKQCDRCKIMFVPKYPIDPIDQIACSYHAYRARIATVNGKREKLFPCCQRTLGEDGCLTGPHVFKIESNYLLHKQKPFVELPDSFQGSLDLVALDCEMSYTVSGLELTRVTVADWSGKSLFDELVKPSAPVIDLNTRWSGITSLSDAKLDLDSVREALGKFVSKSTIIVGHGLENDMRALRITHRQIIDMVDVFPHPSKLPFRYSLQMLAFKVLGKTIQHDTGAGHDSLEDAVTCIELLKRRIANGGPITDQTVDVVEAGITSPSSRIVSVPKNAVKTFDLPAGPDMRESVPALLHPHTKLQTTDRLPFANVPKYPDIANAWWKYPFVQAWLHSFETGAFVGMLELDRNIFGVPVRSDILAKVAKYERDWMEQGTESTKALGQVRGSTRKPFPQKGRGMARVGTIRSPHFRGGYQSHGPRPHNKATDIQRKVYDLGIRTALSTKFAQDQIVIVDRLGVRERSKEELREKLRLLGLSGRKTCFLYGAAQPSLDLIYVMDSFTIAEPTEEVPEGERQLLVASAEHVSVSALLEYEMLVLDKEAVELLEEKYNPERKQ
eukprot:jgi/Hompol1/6498/HPOL_002275-RA